MEKIRLTTEEMQKWEDFQGFSLKHDVVESITKDEWIFDIMNYYECSEEEADEMINNGEGYSSVSLDRGGMLAIETNGDHVFYVSDMES